MSLVIADTNDSPIGIEQQQSPRHAVNYDYARVSELARVRNAENHPVCGCCGANITDNIQEFNKLDVFNMDDAGFKTPLHKAFNRGVLLMVNPNPKEVVASEKYPVEYVQCGDDVLAIRYRMAQEYVPMETFVKGTTA